MKKRIGSLLLILALCFTLLPTAALASDGAWDGSIDTAFAGGTGTESDPYQIADGAQLAYLASEVNKGQPYENSYFVLTADIDLANHDWTPIGNSFSDALFGGTDYHLFAGNLDGKGHTIFNISIGTENAPLESDVFGLFGATGGKISNLNLDDITIYGTAKNVSGYIIGLAGALAGSASGPIENCHVANLSMTMNTPDSGTAAAYWIGGLVGALDGSQHIEECSASGTITDMIRYLNEHLTEPVTLDDLSSRFFISKYYMNRAFKKATGTTVMDYLIYKRVVMARQLMLNGFTASDAANETGFGDYSTFYRAYKKVMGCRPGADRPGKTSPYTDNKMEKAQGTKA